MFLLIFISREIVGNNICKFGRINIFKKHSKYELQLIISGTSQVKYGALIQAAASYLERSQSTSYLVKESKYFKKQETDRLILYLEKNALWFWDVNLENYVSEGAEQKVYLKDGKTVIKLNDAIFYSSWIDYFNNLLLNNYFFPDTAYQLLGFYKDYEVLYAVVQQPFVKATEKTDLTIVKKFMLNNGFINTRNNDYFNPELGIILEDLHDENVLTENGSSQNKEDEATKNGMPVAVFVKKFVKAVESNKFEVYIGGKEVLGVYLKRFFPKFLHYFVLRSKVK